MSMESEIKTALTATGYPVYRNIYTGTGSTYFVVMIDTAPVNFADDAPQHERSAIMMHFVAPITFNDLSLRATVKAALVAAGFSYPSTVNASDENQLRIIYEFEKMGDA